MTDDDIARAWQLAYTEANGRPAPCVEYQNGWFKIDGAWHLWDEVRKMTTALRQIAEDNR